MKKILLCCLLLISGCAQGTAENNQIVGYAEYCIDEECTEKRQIQLEEEHKEILDAYFEGPYHEYYLYTKEESARVVFIDSQTNSRMTYVEYRHTNSYDDDVVVDAFGQYHCYDTPLTDILKSLDAEEIEEYVYLNPHMPMNYSMISYFQANKTDPLYLTFCVNEEDFRNDKQVLAGLAEMAASQMDISFYSSQEVWENQVLDKACRIDVSEVEAFADTLINDFHWPELETCFLGSTLYYDVYYDNENKEIIMKEKNRDFIIYTYQWLIPLSKNKDVLTLARVPVLFIPSLGNIPETKQVVLPDGTKLEKGYDDQTFDMIYDRSNQLDLFEVTLQNDKISTIKQINQAEINVHPISIDQFALHENGDIQIYSLENKSISAWVYNHQIQAICRGMQGNILTSFSSNLSENDSLILVNLSYDKNYFRDEYTWIFDKQEGRLIDIGTLNEKYFDGKMNEIALKQINEKMPVCSVNYDENREIEQCAVPVYFAEEGNEDIYDQSAYPFYFNEQNELCIDINIRSYGSYSDTMTLRFEM